MQEKEKNKFDRFLTILLILLCIGILICAVTLVSICVKRAKDKNVNKYQPIATLTTSPGNSEPQAVTKPVEPTDAEVPTGSVDDLTPAPSEDPETSIAPVQPTDTPEPNPTEEASDPTVTIPGTPTQTVVPGISPNATPTPVGATPEPTKSAVPTTKVTPVPTNTAVPTNKVTPVPTKKATPTITPKPVTTEIGTPVSNHGKLSVNKDGKLVDKNGNLYQLHGVSTHGLQWFPQYVNKAAFKSLRDDWNVNLVRLAMYTVEGGYCQKDAAGKENLKRLVKNGVDYATELGMYVIIDWHVLQECDPNKYTDESIKFFEEMARTYKNNVNVIYEICNEPNGGTTWSQIKTYAEKVIKAIRAIDSDAIIVVGTPTWSQEVDKAAANPITGYKNIMYTIHFYAGTHKDWLINKMVAADAKKLPIFCTEFGITDASGNGNLDEASANKWIAKMNELNISYCCWNLANKNESSCLLKSSCTKTSGWTKDDISGQGIWLIKTYGGKLLGGTPTKPEPTRKPGATPTPTPKPNPTKTPTPTPKPNPTKTPTPAPTQPVAPNPLSYKKDVDGYGVTLNSNNGWISEGNRRNYQLNAGLTNKTGSDVSTWKIVITFDKDIKLDQFWSCEVTVSGKTMTITPAGYNAHIANGASISDIGVIFSASSEVKIVSVSCK